MSPQRPRAHQLETESLLAFRRFIPTGWVVRELPHDYGVDLEVEIFEDGRATGLTFKVQLKSSEAAPPDGEAISVSVRTETLSYWMSLDVPVLVVYYFADSGEIFARWAHSYDPHLRRRRNPKASTFQFTEDDRLTDSSTRQLASDVAAIRQVKSGSIPRPIPLSVIVEGTPWNNLSTIELRRRLRDLDRRSQGLVGLGSSEDDAVVVAAIAEDQIQLALPARVATFTTHLVPGQYSSDPERLALIGDVLMGTAFLLSIKGARSEAARLAALVGPQSFISAQMEMAIWLAHIFEMEGRQRDSLLFCSAYLLAGDTELRDVADIYFGMGIQALPSLSTEEVDQLVLQLRRRINLEREQNEPKRAAAVCYNLARVEDALGRHERSLGLLDEALQHDGSYGEREYFFRERAGTYWDLGQLQLAASDYRKALELGGDPGEIEPLLIDALLHGGFYEEAFTVAGNWEPTGHELDHLAIVDSIILDLVISNTGLATQVRQPLTEEEEAAYTEGGVTAAETMVTLRSSDALDPRLWMHWLMASGAGPFDQFRAILLSAAVMRAPELWGRAAAAAFAAGVPDDVLNAVIDCGLRFQGDELFLLIESIVREDRTMESLYRIVENRAAQTTQAHSYVTIRLIGVDDSED